MANTRQSSKTQNRWASLFDWLEHRITVIQSNYSQLGGFKQTYKADVKKLCEEAKLAHKKGTEKVTQDDYVYVQEPNAAELEPMQRFNAAVDREKFIVLTNYLFTQFEKKVTNKNEIVKKLNDKKKVDDSHYTRMLALTLKDILMATGDLFENQKKTIIDLNELKTQDRYKFQAPPMMLEGLLKMHADYLIAINTTGKPLLEFLKVTPRPYDATLRKKTALAEPMEIAIQHCINSIKHFASITFPVTDQTIKEVASAYRKTVAELHEVIMNHPDVPKPLSPENEQIIREAEKNYVFNLFFGAGFAANIKTKIFCNDILVNVFHHDDAIVVEKTYDYYQSDKNSWIIKNSSNPKNLFESANIFGYQHLIDALVDISGNKGGSSFIDSLINLTNCSLGTFADKSEMDALLKLLNEAKTLVAEQNKSMPNWIKPALPTTLSNRKIEPVTGVGRPRFHAVRKSKVSDDFFRSITIQSDMAALANEIIKQFNMPANRFYVIANAYMKAINELHQADSADNLLENAASLAVDFMRNIYNEISSIRDVNILKTCQFITDRLNGVFTQQEMATKNIKGLIDDLLKKYCVTSNKNAASLTN